MLRKDDRGRRMSRKFTNLRHKQNKAERIAEKERAAAVVANRRTRHEVSIVLRSIALLPPETWEEIII